MFARVASMPTGRRGRCCSDGQFARETGWTCQSTHRGRRSTTYWALTALVPRGRCGGRRWRTSGDRTRGQATGCGEVVQSGVLHDDEQVDITPVIGPPVAERADQGRPGHGLVLLECDGRAPSQRFRISARRGAAGPLRVMTITGRSLAEPQRPIDFLVRSGRCSGPYEGIDFARSVISDSDRRRRLR